MIIAVHNLIMMSLKVTRRPSATAEPSDMMVMKLSLVMEEVNTELKKLNRMNNICLKWRGEQN